MKSQLIAWKIQKARPQRDTPLTVSTFSLHPILSPSYQHPRPFKQEDLQHPAELPLADKDPVFSQETDSIGLAASPPHQPLREQVHPIFMSGICPEVRTVGNSSSLLVQASCAICLQRKANSSISGCDHSFCLQCIRRWAKKKNNCPLCRLSFESISSRKRTYKVEPVAPLLRARTGVVRPQQPRRIVLIPLLMNPPQLCYFYDQHGNFLLNQPMQMQQNALSFFLPH